MMVKTEASLKYDVLKILAELLSLTRKNIQRPPVSPPKETALSSNLTNQHKPTKHYSHVKSSNVLSHRVPQFATPTNNDRDRFPAAITMIVKLRGCVCESREWEVIKGWGVVHLFTFIISIKLG